MRAKLISLIIILFLSSCWKTGEEQNKTAVNNEENPIEFPEENGKRVALVIGNSDYEYTEKLKNPENDANDIADILRNLKFEVLEYTNLDKQEFIQAIKKYGNELDKNGVALFFYAGHGIQANGINYLVPTDAKPEDETDLDIYCIETNYILAKMEKSQTNLNIIILDACRNNPYERSWRGIKTTGLATMKAPKGTIIAYATDPGKLAQDGTGRNSPYTESLKKYLATPNYSFVEILDYTGKAVSQNYDQRPWMSKSYYGKFYIAGKITKNDKKDEEHEKTTEKQEYTKTNNDKDKENEKPTEKPEYPKTDNDIVWQDNNHGIFTDSRDNKKYRVVKIGNQIWLAENFNFTQGIPHITDDKSWNNLKDNNTDQAWCYYDNKNENGKTYGALYTYAAALKAAPSGWHLPTKQEFETLLNNYGGVGEKAYKALIKGGKSDLNVLFAGWRYRNGYFYLKDYSTAFWSATEFNNPYAWDCFLYTGYKTANLFSINKSFGFSVRLLRD